MTPVIITQSLLGKSVSPHHFVGEGPKISDSTTTESCVKSWRFTLARRCWVFLFGRCFLIYSMSIHIYVCIYIYNWTEQIQLTFIAAGPYTALSPLRWISGWKARSLTKKSKNRETGCLMKIIMFELIVSFAKHWCFSSKKLPMTDPWEWYIYTYMNGWFSWDQFGSVNIPLGSTMDPRKTGCEFQTGQSY